jgi:hypothetical protein
VRWWFVVGALAVSSGLDGARHRLGPRHLSPRREGLAFAGTRLGEQRPGIGVLGHLGEVHRGEDEHARGPTVGVAEPVRAERAAWKGDRVAGLQAAATVGGPQLRSPVEDQE